jgi:hypothetical protein
VRRIWSEVAMLTALVPADGSQASLCADRHAGKCIEDGESLSPAGRRRFVLHRFPSAGGARRFFSTPRSHDGTNRDANAPA